MDTYIPLSTCYCISFPTSISADILSDKVAETKLCDSILGWSCLGKNWLVFVKFDKALARFAVRNLLNLDSQYKLTPCTIELFDFISDVFNF